GELHAPDIAKLSQVFQGMPAGDRPIRTFDNDSRWEMDEMRKTFPGVDFDKMTSKEYLKFVQKWAAKPDSVKTAEKGDQTYLFRFFKAAGISPDDANKIYAKVFDSRVDRMLSAYRKNKDDKDIPFDDGYNAQTAYSYLQHHPGNDKYLAEID